MRWGLALSGGGARGGAHAGVIRALQEHGLRPDVVSGTSAGAIVAGLYGASCDADALDEWVDDIAARGKRLLDPDFARLLGSLFTLVACRKLYAEGIYKAARLERVFREMTGDLPMCEAKLPIALVSADINCAKKVVFTNAPVLQPDNDIVVVRDAHIWEGIRASTAIPVTFRPFLYEDMRLVDGGVMDMMPIDIARRMNAQRVIAVQVGYNGECKPEVDNILEIGMQSISLMGYAISESQRNAADIIIAPNLDGIKTLDIEKVPEAVEAGYRAAMAAMPRIKKVLGVASVA